MDADTRSFVIKLYAGVLAIIALGAAVMIGYRYYLGEPIPASLTAFGGVVLAWIAAELRDNRSGQVADRLANGIGTAAAEQVAHKAADVMRDEVRAIGHDAAKLASDAAAERTADIVRQEATSALTRKIAADVARILKESGNA